MATNKLVLNESTLTAIKNDPLLYGKVASTLGVAISSMPKILKDNSAKLTQYSVLLVIKEHLGLTDDAELIGGELSIWENKANISFP